MGSYYRFIRRIYYKIINIGSDIGKCKYLKQLPQKLESIRKKDKIRVVFVIHEVSQWKTENLYIAMLKHPRFEPLLCPALLASYTPASAVEKYLKLIKYLKYKNYEYQEERDINILNPDITFYSQPYDGTYTPMMSWKHNKGLLMHVSYAFNNTNAVHSYNVPLMNLACMFFVENDLVKDAASKVMSNKGRNIIATGVPMSETLMLPKESFNDPWKPQKNKKIRIIWAPHHTIKEDSGWFNFSSFLNMKDLMLELSDKYKEHIQIAFKPHPRLYLALIEEWGKQKTDEYYKKWDTNENTQVSDAEYINLFKYSDAMIHDCGSFIIEYLFENKPVLYTARSEETIKQLNQFGLKGYNTLIHGNDREDIVQFIENLINGIDTHKEKRTEFITSYLIPSFNNSASNNIINAILGK